MEFGREERKLSKKNQVVFPKTFRNDFGDNLIITKGFDKNLFLVAAPNIDILMTNPDKSLFVSKNSRALRRYLLGNANRIELDSSKRFVIPEYLREFASLSTDIVFARFGNYIEIWDKNAWDSQQEFLDITAPAIVEEISRNKTESSKT